MPCVDTDHTVAIFRQINKGMLHTNHDSLEFPDGEIVLLTRLCEVVRHPSVDATPPKGDLAVSDIGVLGGKKTGDRAQRGGLTAPLVPTSATIDSVGTSSDTPWIAVATR